ncbi:MAG: dihydrolipoyl dehydrogenase [Leptospirillum sp.]|jgi:dihydrolipoamide dehydrogenase
MEGCALIVEDLDCSFDLIVVGGGPAGYMGALRASELGMRVALVESRKVGGVCLHQGCIPTKSLLEVSSLIQKTATSSNGLYYDPPKIEHDEVVAFGQSVINRLHQGIKHLLKTAGVMTFESFGALLGIGKVGLSESISPHVLHGKNILLATGSRPKAFPGLPFDHERVIDSSDALLLNPAGKKIGILGGGVVGVEFSQIFTSLGGSVTILEREPTLLPGEDPELVSILSRELDRQGVVLRCGIPIAEVSRTDQSVSLSLKPSNASKKSAPEELSFDYLLVAIGRVPNTESLGLDSVGLSVSPSGSIMVDGSGWTGVEGLYAAGDLVGGAMLAHAATHEAIVSVEHMAGLNPAPIDPNTVPRVVYTHPELVSVGMTLDQAQKKGFHATQKKFPMMANGRSLIHGDRRGIVKMVVDEQSGALLGFGGVGPGLSEILPVATLAIGLPDGADRLSHSIFPHPTVAETIWDALKSR